MPVADLRAPETAHPGGSALAAGTVRGRPPALPHRFYCSAADPARQAFAAVDRVVELEIAGLAAAVDVIAKRRSSLGDGVLERLADGVDQPGEPGSRQAMRGRCRPDPRAKERLVCIDVANTREQAVVH